MLTNEIQSVQIAVSKKHMPAFMINFMISFKCNLDCSYCESHDNLSIPIPLEVCKKTIDFIFRYTDLILSVKPKYEQAASLNLIGGEPFTHPDIEEILTYANTLYKERYEHKWRLSVCLTTNGIAGNNLLKKCLPYVDKWTVSYHTESLPKQKELTLQNIHMLHQSSDNFEVRVMAPPDKDKFDDARSVHSLLISQGINALMKPINTKEYGRDETRYLKSFWNNKNTDVDSTYSTEKGITCCSERPLVIDSNRKNPTNFIPMNNFEGWYCALNWNFLHIDKNSRVFHNSSCHITYGSSKEEPIGTIDNYEEILDRLKTQIDNKTVPVVICPKQACQGCGMCATKAKTKEEFEKLMKFHLTDTSILNYSLRSSTG